VALEAVEEARTPAVEAVERCEVEVAVGKLVRRALHVGSGDGLSPSRLQSRGKRGPHVGGTKETHGESKGGDGAIEPGAWVWTNDPSPRGSGLARHGFLQL